MAASEEVSLSQTATAWVPDGKMSSCHKLNLEPGSNLGKLNRWQKGVGILHVSKKTIRLCGGLSCSSDMLKMEKRLFTFA